MKIFYLVLIKFFLLSFSYSCENLNSFYLNPETILLKGSRDLGIKVIDAKAVKSNDFKNFYFVQYKMETPNNGTIYPMFAMNKPFAIGGTIYSMDDVAIAVSGYGDGRKTKATFSKNDDGFDKASSCLK